jgi:hypothetical protein
VLAIGTVGVDKCLQALSVTDLEVVSQSNGARKIACSVRKMSMCVEHERHEGLINELVPDAGFFGTRRVVIDRSAGSSTSSTSTIAFPCSKSSEAKPRKHAQYSGGLMCGHSANDAQSEKKGAQDGPRIGFLFETWICDKGAYAWL